jgi:hypothetical protein
MTRAVGNGLRGTSCLLHCDMLGIGCSGKEGLTSWWRYSVDGTQCRYLSIGCVWGLGVGELLNFTILTLDDAVGHAE